MLLLKLKKILKVLIFFITIPAEMHKVDIKFFNTNRLNFVTKAIYLA